MFKPVNVLLMTGALVLPRPGIMAQSSDEGTVPANQYEHVAPILPVHYSRSGFSGESQLRYRLGNSDPLDFSGDEIRVEKTEIGQIVSVTVRPVPDLETVTLSIVIPDINADAGERVLFESSIILTTNHTAIGGKELVKGPLQTSWSPKVIGQASSVAYPGAGETGVFGKITQSPTCGGPQIPGKACIGPLPDTAALLPDGADQTFLIIF